MSRGGYLFRQLVGLVAAAGLPLLLLLAYNIHSAAENSRRQAVAAVGNHAVAVARDVEGLLQSTQRYLDYLATQSAVRAMDPGQCDPAIQGVTQRRAHFADVVVVDVTGRLLCSAVDPEGEPATGRVDLPWVDQALHAMRPVVGKPYVEPVAQKHVVAVAQALRDSRARPIGVVAVLVDLESLQRSWHRYRLPPGARLSVITDDGTMVVSAPDFERWVGKDVSAAVDKARRAQPGDTGSTLGIDGVERTFARLPVEPWGWNAVATVPTAEVLASYHAQLRRSLVGALLATVIAVGLTLWLARRLVAPLRALVATADAVRDGDTVVRADTAARGEFGEVAAAFNAMLDRLGRSQAALRASQRQYADLFANIGMLSVMTDRSGRITQVNDSVLAATGWSRADIVGRPAGALLAADDTAAAEALQRAFATGQINPVAERKIATRAGGSLTVRWHYSLLHDETGQLVGFASLGEDVTEAREAALRERRHLDFYAALSRMNGAIVRSESEDTLWSEICRICVEHGHASVAYVSVVSEDGAFARPVASAGPAQEFLSGKDWSLDASRPEGRGLTATAVRTGQRFVVDDAETHPATAPWRDRGRAIGTRSLAAFPFRRGQRVAGVLTLHMTVPGFFDERVVALIDEMVADLSFALDHLDRVAQLRAAQQRLIEHEQQLAGLVETAMDAIITVDVGQRIRLFNQAAAAMFGVPAAEVIGQPLDRFIPPELRPAHSGYLASFAATGGPARRIGTRQPLTGVRSNGQTFPIEASVSKWGQGDATLMTIVIRDATEQRQAEEARLARAAAESSSRAKSEFLSRMSHELRTPLNAIVGFSQLLQAETADGLRPAQAQQVEYIRQAGWHLLALVSDVLDVSRIEEGRLSVDVRDIDAQEALDDAVRLTQGLAQQHRLTLAGAPDAAPAAVRADPTRLRQVLLNVLSNAAKYNRPGGRIDVGVSAQGDRVRFVVADTGLGMTAQQLQHLYEPFNRLGREQGSIEGTGLGLALTRQLVALMHGRMTVHSEVDRGTRVEIWLPAGTAPRREGARPAEAVAPAGGEPQGTVLYIEDNPVNRLLVEQLLGRWSGVTLLQAEDGSSGLHLARSARPDLVLLDMRLPDMTGHEVLRLLRGEPGTAGLFVIALSGDAMQEDVDAALRAGADVYWTKPFDVRQFLREMAGRLAPGGAPAAVQQEVGS